MHLLNEFQYGKINHTGKLFQKQRGFDKAFRILTKNEENLTETLNEQEKELFDKFKACYDKMIQITECQTIIKGFKLNARFIVTCIVNEDNIFH